MISKLTKIKIPELTVISYAFEDYINHLEPMVKSTVTNNETKMSLSIAQEMYKNIKKTLSKDFLPSNTSLKLPFHKAIVFVSALLHYKNNLKNNSYEAALLTRFTNNILPNLN
ncbi:hypothetical protein ACIVBQ_000571 [Tenacibaculum discolor]